MTIAPVIANPLDLNARIAKEYSSLDARADGRTYTGTAHAPDGAQDSRNSGAQTKVADLTSQLARETRQAAPLARELQSDSRVSDNTLVKLVNKIIIEAHAQGASDIHIESNPGKSDTCIRFRKDGDLEDYLQLPHAYCNALVSRIKVMAELNISERRHPQDGKIDFGKHGPLPIELRVAIIPTANSLEDVVLRILGGAEPLPLDQVGFSAHDLAALKTMIARSYGLMLVCGPTGSGKTTTLHSLLREINRRDLKIWTAEDPIEITQPGLRQVQVHPKIDWTFAAAMRAFLRADPDVIMVGEMRDAETAKIGIEASLTGHLVLSTLHTNSAAESIVRLLDIGMDPFNFADALIGILSQRLARKLCLNCAEPYVASELEVSDLLGEYCNEAQLDRATVLRQWQADFGKDGHLVLRKAVGCDACRDGYKGRIVVYELLPGTPQIKHLVRSHATVPQLLAAAQEGNMLSLRQNAIAKLLKGILDLPSARAVSS
jgi:type II secretory ATPase GspE/PulE/Tfp pilus assembly ATPase PilB-like protein